MIKVTKTKLIFLAIFLAFGFFSTSSSQASETANTTPTNQGTGSIHPYTPETEITTTLEKKPSLDLSGLNRVMNEPKKVRPPKASSKARKAKNKRTRKCKKQRNSRGKCRR